MGEKVTRSLKPLKEAGFLFTTAGAFSDPPIAASLKRNQFYICSLFEGFLITIKINLGDGDDAGSYSDKLDNSLSFVLGWTDDPLDEQS